MDANMDVETAREAIEDSYRKNPARELNCYKKFYLNYLDNAEKYGLTPKEVVYNTQTNNGQNFADAVFGPAKRSQATPAEFANHNDINLGIKRKRERFLLKNTKVNRWNLYEDMKYKEDYASKIL